MISVIVPVYNVEKYLDRCVQSILAQTYSDFELLLVDDGSPDRCGEMCDEYAKSDERVRVIHKQNGGLSDARNCGIEHATGDFFQFVDSDDYIHPEMLETLYRILTAQNADLAVCSACDVFEGTEVPMSKESNEFTLNKVESYRYMLQGKGLPSVCNKLYKRETVGSARFATGKLYEDGFFLPDVMKNVAKTAVTTMQMYYYFRRADSIVTKSFSHADLDVIEAYERCAEIVKRDCPAALDSVKFRIYYAYFAVLDKMLVCNDFKSIPEYKKIVEYLRSHTWDILRVEGFGTPRKLAAVALKFSVQLYKQILETKKRMYKMNE